MAQRLATRRGQGRVAREQELGIIARRADELAMHLDARDTAAPQAGLAGSQHVAFSAQRQILLGNAEAVLGVAHDLKPRLRGWTERRPVEQEAGRASAAAADAAAQLVQLRKPEALGMLDHHD